MTPREPRFELVRTDAGFHARFRAANGRVVWTTEVYKRRGKAVKAVELIAGHPLYVSPFAAWPEVLHAGEHIELRDADERSEAVA